MATVLEGTLNILRVSCRSRVGYGTITPKSAGGRLFTVMYALFGIPLQLATLAAVGRWESRAFDKCLRPCGFDDEHRSTWSVRKHVARNIINLTIFFGLFAAIPSFVFEYMENWKFGEGVYYALISLTTIGFGDYEAG